MLSRVLSSEIWARWVQPDICRWDTQHASARQLATWYLAFRQSEIHIRFSYLENDTAQLYNCCGKSFCFQNGCFGGCQLWAQMII